MNFDISKSTAWVDLLIKAEIHAFMILITGCALVLTGHKDEGMLVLGAAVAVFKGGGRV